LKGLPDFLFPDEFLEWPQEFGKKRNESSIVTQDKEGKQRTPEDWSVLEEFFPPGAKRAQDVDLPSVVRVESSGGSTATPDVFSTSLKFKVSSGRPPGHRSSKNPGMRRFGMGTGSRYKDPALRAYNPFNQVPFNQRHLPLRSKSGTATALCDDEVCTYTVPVYGGLLEQLLWGKTTQSQTLVLYKNRSPHNTKPLSCEEVEKIKMAAQMAAAKEWKVVEMLNGGVNEWNELMQSVGVAE
jgi:hypothetical protein